MAIETFRAELPHGITLSCRAAGPPGAPVIVFLHGFPEAAFIWDELMARFGAHYRCIAPNLRGYADSSAPEGVAAYRAKPLARDIATLIEHLAPVAPRNGVGPMAALVAHDWGGAVAWTLAIHQPQLVLRLVMINSPHPGPFLRDLQTDPAQQAASAYMNFLCRPDAAALLAEDDFARLWPFFTRMGGDAWLTEAVKARYRDVWRQGLEPALNYYRASPLRPPTAEDASVMGIRFEAEQITVRVPTTVIWGDADTALPVKLTDGLRQWVPELRLVRVPGAGHWIVHEQPGRVAAEIEAALAA